MEVVEEVQAHVKSRLVQSSSRPVVSLGADTHARSEARSADPARNV